MDKRCRVCTAKFGLFKKEVECNKCRIALCKDCRSYSITENQANLAVCKKCHTAFTTGNTKPRPRSPPMNFKREMEAKRQQSTNCSVPPHRDVGEMEEEDLELAARLDKLIQETPNSKDTSVTALESRLSKLTADERAVSQQEIEYRFAKLKGDRPPAVKVHSIRKSVSDRTPSTSNNETSDRQVKKLIRQYTEEVSMETEYDPSMRTDETFDPDGVPEDATADDMIKLAQEALKHEKEQETKNAELDIEMQERLRKLQGMSPSIDCTPIPQLTRTKSTDLSDEEEDKLIKKLTDEAGLEVYLGKPRGPALGGGSGTYRSGTEGGQGGKTGEEDDQLPWCVICNDDATLRCHGCDGDLYCRRCFKEGHDKFELQEHRTTKFSPPKNMDFE